MNNCSYYLRNRIPRGMRYQILLGLVLGVVIGLWPAWILWVQADEAPPPIDTFPYAAYLPIVQTQPEAPTPTLFALDWDPRLTERGAVLVAAQVATGDGYWKLVKAQWFDEQAAGGRHHILVDVLDSKGQRATEIPIKVAWKDGNAQIFTELKPGEAYAANYAMFDIAPSYSAQPSTDAPADRVEGMGLGSLELPKWKVHTSYGLVWQWTIASTPPLTVTPTLTTTPVITPEATATISPTIPLTLTATPTPTGTLTLTPVATMPPLLTPIATMPTVATPTPTATPLSTSTPTATPTPPPLPLAQAVVVGCQPNSRGSRFEGYVYRNGQPVNGDRVVFSYEADGPWVTQPTTAGNSVPGFYAHIISAGVSRAGSWYAWLVDQNRQRISAIAAFTTDGEGGACNIVVVNFIH